MLDIFLRILIIGSLFVHDKDLFIIVIILRRTVLYTVRVYG